jgi:voltage-gated potassium channel
VPADPSDLASLPLFGSLSESERAEIASLFEPKEVGAGVRLVGVGATGHAFFVIAEGEVAVSVHGEEVGTLGEGDYFGELSLLGAGRRTATVTTTAPSRVLVLFGSDFDRFRAKCPEIAAELEATMQQRQARS